MKKIILFVALLAGTVSLYAQTPGGTITGKITDGGDQKIIDAATISLYREVDSSLVKVNLTDTAGNFEFLHIPPGKYYLSASSIGHVSSYSKVINVKG